MARTGNSATDASVNGVPKKAKKKTSPLRIIVYTLVIIISWLPLLLPLLGTWAMPVHDFSSYNTDWNGTSSFRDAVNAEGYETYTMISSLNALSKLNSPGVLILIGPSALRPFGAFDLVAILGFLLSGGSVIIADDFGSANTLFLPINALLGPGTGLSIGFTTGVLYDYGSYYRNPVLPLIRGLSPHPINQGVDAIMLNYASVINITFNGEMITGGSFVTLSSPLVEGAGLLSVPQNASSPVPSLKQSPSLADAVGILAVSSQYSWVDIDEDGTPDPGNETVGPFPVAIALNLAPLAPLLGLNSSVPGRLALISDPSIFVNEMWDQADNAQFAINLINWMAGNNQSLPIIFDESHSDWPPTSAVVYYGLVLLYTLSVSGTWFLAPLAPLSVVYAVKRWLPKATEVVEFTPTDIFRRRSNTRFALMLGRLRMYETYNDPLVILYRKWKREFITALKLDGWTSTSDLIEAVSSRRPDINAKQLHRYLKICENSQKTKKRISKDAFMNTFLGITAILKDLQGGDKT